MNGIQKTHANSKIRAMEIGSELYYEVVREHIVLQVVEITNKPEWIIMEYVDKDKYQI